MREPLRSGVRARLEAIGGKVRANHIQQIRCPTCGKREAWACTEAPWVVQCGRLNKCGDRFHVKDLFPDLFQTWTERYGRPARPTQDARPAPGPDAGPDADPADPTDTTPVADAYLEIGRGFDLARIRGFYSEETYFDRRLGIGSTTVRFALPHGPWWERLIDRPERFGRQKARFQPGHSYAGHWWAPPGAQLAIAEELWLTEGIFDAIALQHAGLIACALMSANNYPDAALAELAADCHARACQRPILVFALDDDPAGVRYTHKFVERATADGWVCTAALRPRRGQAKRLDWNDSWQRQELTPKHLSDYRYHGALLIAKSPTEKAILIHTKTGQREFWFDWRDRLWWLEIDAKKYQAALEQAGFETQEQAAASPTQLAECARKAKSVTEICNCRPHALYYMANTLTDEAWYTFRVSFPHDHKPVINTLTGSTLGAPAEFRKRLLHIAPGALWSGSAGQLERVLRDQLYAIKTVDTIDFIGYSRDHSTYVFTNLAVKDGKVYKLNDEDYFDIGRNSIKTLAQSPDLLINDNPDEYTTSWAMTIYEAFGGKGIVALAFFLGSLFAEQIRDRQKSYPFLEIVGEPGSGKSTLIEFLWKLLGRPIYEGFDPAKSTMAGRARNFAQVANLPVSLTESDRTDDTGLKQRQFDWDELKTAYNGRSVRARGLRNAGNDTYEPPFRGAIVISQNAPVSGSDAILQRICHLSFSLATQTEATKAAAKVLEATPIESVSGFLLHALRNEAKILALYDLRFPGRERYLSEHPGVRVNRLALNHAQLMALIECFGSEGLGLLSDAAILDALKEVISMAQERQQAINADCPTVQEFWEAYDYLQGLGSEAAAQNHLRPDGGLIAVNLKQFESAANERHLRIPSGPDLKRNLRSSKARKFVDANRAVHSILTNKTTRCWVFENTSR